MRKRKWVLVLAALLMIIIFGGYISWRVTKANEKVKELLLTRIRPFLDQESNIDKLEIDLSSINIKGVSLISKNRAFTLKIENVRLGYRLSNLFWYGLVPHKVAHQVVLVRPVVTFRDISDDQEKYLDEDDWIKLREIIEIFKTVRRITVADAEVILENNFNKRVKLAHRLNGWLQTDPLESANIRLAGNLFKSKNKNLHLTGKLNLLSGQPLSIILQIEESEPSPELPLLLPDFIQVTGGKMIGEGTFDIDKGFSGFIEFQNGSFSFKDKALYFEDVNTRADIEDKNLVINGEIGKFNGSRVNLHGRIENIFNPQLQIDLKCPNFNTAVFIRQFNPDFQTPIINNSSFDFHISGSIRNPEMEGNFHASHLQVYGIEFDNFHSSIGLQDSIFTLRGFADKNNELNAELYGETKFLGFNQMTKLSMDVRGSFLSSLPKWLQNKMLKCDGEIGIKLDGTLDNLYGKAYGNIAAISLEGETLKLYPLFDYKNHRLKGKVRSNKVFNIEGETQNPFKRDVTWKMEAKGIDAVIDFLFNSQSHSFTNGLSISSKFSGTRMKSELSIIGNNNGTIDSSRAFDIKLISKEQRRSKREINLQATYQENGNNIDMLSKWTVLDQVVVIDRCEIGDFFSLKGIYPLNKKGELNGTCIVSNLDLKKLHSIIPNTKPYKGEINGKVTVSGVKSKPEIILNCSLRNGIFHSVGILKGDISTCLKEGIINELTCSIYKNNVPFLDVFAEIVTGDSLIGKVSGEEIDFGDLALALTGNSEILHGRGEIDIQISGDQKSPLLYGKVNIHHGSLGRIPFNNFQIFIFDSLSNKNQYLNNGILHIQKGRILCHDNLGISLSGSIPHSKTEDWDLSFSAQGHILGLLPEVSRFFRKAKDSSGEIIARLGGRPGSWILGSGRISLYQGQIELVSFIKKIKNLQCEADLRPGSRFLHINNLSGEIAKCKFSISNNNDEDFQKGGIPLTIEGLGVHLGNLLVQTCPKGIRAHIPGLMETRDEGRIRFCGKVPEKPFSISGPSSNPKFHGTLYLSDIRITYPLLIINESNENDQLLRFVNNINWDIKVIPKKDVHYVRDINSPLGNVYADLKLKDGFKGLNFKGIIQEGTFHVWGNLVSTEGTIDVLDRYFKPERMTFDYPKGTTTPLVSGRAFTTVIDSTGMPSSVWFSLTTLDTTTGLVTEGGSWKNIHFRFDTDNPNLGRSEADLMAALGYSTESIKDRAYDALGIQVENRVFRPIFRPIEREIRRYLGLDIVRLSSMFSRNLFQIQYLEQPTFNAKWLLRSTKLTIGKYLAPGFFIIYSGQVQSDLGLQYHTQGLGFRHALTMEYSIRPDLFIEMEYTYDSQLLADRREDKRIWLRHIFPF
jgi:hypothetical protein